MKKNGWNGLVEFETTFENKDNSVVVIGSNTEVGAQLFLRFRAQGLTARKLDESSVKIGVSGWDALHLLDALSEVSKHVKAAVRTK
jgi:hypothetical protein